MVESTCQCRRLRFNPHVGKIPWSRKWQPMPVFLHGESHGQRSLASYSPQGCKELDMTEQLTLLLLCRIRGFPGSSTVKESTCNAGDVSSIPGTGRSPGVGNGNSLQDSCLKSPMDRGAWRVTAHGVAKSWTRLSTHTGRHCRIRGVFLKDTIKGRAFSTGKISKQLSYLFRGDWIILWIEHRWY